MASIETHSHTYSGYERSPKRNIYPRSNKGTHSNAVTFSKANYNNDEDRRKVFPTIHENKRLKIDDSKSMKTVGVLSYSQNRNNIKGNDSSNSFPRNRGKSDEKALIRITKDQLEQYKSQSKLQRSPLTETPDGPMALANHKTQNGGLYHKQKLLVNNSPQSSPRKQHALAPITTHMLPQPAKEDGSANMVVSGKGIDEDSSTGKKPDTIEGLPMKTKFDVLNKNRQLVYKETVWTRKRVDKLADIGFGPQVIVKRVKASKEDKRWDHIMKFIQEDLKQIRPVWIFLSNDYPNLFAILSTEYMQLMRDFFKPKLSNLQTTPANSNKMVDILMEQADGYDDRLYEIDHTLSKNDKFLKDTTKILHEARNAVYNWAGRELPEPKLEGGSNPDEQQHDIKVVSQDLLDTILVASTEKEQVLADTLEQNAELKKRVGRMAKALKEKDRQLKERQVSFSTNHE